ncbi:MAG: hypothetical protein OES84_05035, partial [Kiritimatiellaceae bacterium]|nr:hypothetical protein [Kiritimatiellaceae bacterium]
MNLIRLSILALSLTLAGCASKPDHEGEEVIMPKMQQNTYLSHAKQPQHFGFHAFPVPDGGIAVRGEARQHPNHLSATEFDIDGIPAIKMRGNARRKNMIVLMDPSSPSSWIEFNKSQEMDTTFLGMNGKNIPYRGGYNTGGADGYMGVIKNLRINNLFIENTPVYVRMATGSLGPMNRGIKVPHIDAVFGYDTIKTFEYVQFDFNSNVIKLSSTIQYVPHDGLLMTVASIVPIKKYGLAVEGAIYGESTPIILDFAGDYHFARGDKKVSTTKQVSLGEVVARSVPTLLLPINDSPPRAGRKLLEKYIITICP